MCDQFTVDVSPLTTPATCFYSSYLPEPCEPAAQAVRILGRWHGATFDPAATYSLSMCARHARIWQANHQPAVRCARGGCNEYATAFPLMPHGALPLCETHAQEESNPS